MENERYAFSVRYKVDGVEYYEAHSEDMRGDSFLKLTLAKRSAAEFARWKRAFMFIVFEIDADENWIPVDCWRRPMVKYKCDRCRCVFTDDPGVFMHECGLGQRGTCQAIEGIESDV